ncbi:MAG: nucleotidyltransferase [Clostridiales bacterium]|nr:nucleotidyltransferase [Clostridiales bacterium]
MQKPVLCILAAGMGSRYGGGIKQMDPIDSEGCFIIDYSVYDAMRAGFEEVVFIIKHAIEADFKATIGARVSPHIKVSYAFQELSMLPEGITLSPDRVKPLGTTHALLSAEETVAGRPFAVINADDYYGPEAFRLLYGFLTNGSDDHIAVGYLLENTLTDHGAVNRGECIVEDGFLAHISERIGIRKSAEGAEYVNGAGDTVFMPRGTTVSMNCWGFRPSLFPLLRERFEKNLAAGLAENPLKYEDLLPNAVCEAILAGKARVQVQPTKESWFGVTYQEDKPKVMESIRRLKAAGVYGDKLWR